MLKLRAETRVRISVVNLFVGPSGDVSGVGAEVHLWLRFRWRWIGRQIDLQAPERAVAEPHVEEGFFVVAGDFGWNPTGFDGAVEESFDMEEGVVGGVGGPGREF